MSEIIEVEKIVPSGSILSGGGAPDSNGEQDWDLNALYDDAEQAGIPPPKR